MNDLEKLKNLLKEFDVGFDELVRTNKQTSIYCGEGENKISGYSGFFTEFVFDENGKFL